MAREIFVAVSLLVLLQCFLPGVRATQFNYNSVFAGTTTDTLTSLGAYYQGKAISVSCSSASVQSYKSHSYAIAYASSAANTEVYIGAAVQAASDAIASAGAKLGSKCLSTQDFSLVWTVAEACASAMVKGRAASLAHAYAQGGSRASSSSCAYSAAYAGAFVKALAKAVSGAVSGGNGAKCEVFSTTAGSAYVEALAKVTVTGMAGSWSQAFALGTSSGKKGPAFAEAGSSAMYYNDVGVYAKAVASLFAYACGKCGSTNCKYCNGWVPEGDSTYTETAAIAAKGRIALASAISDASSRLCSRTITTKLAVEGLVAAISDVCIQITVSANGWAKASGKSYACTGAFSSTKLYALSNTYASVVADAMVLATKKDLCATKAIANIWAEASATVSADVFLKACVAGCAGKLAGASNTYSDAASRCYSAVSNVYSEALTDSFAEVVTECACGGDCWCCNVQPTKRQCDYDYVA